MHMSNKGMRGGRSYSLALNEGIPLRPMVEVSLLLSSTWRQVQHRVPVSLLEPNEVLIGALWVQNVVYSEV